MEAPICEIATLSLVAGVIGSGVSALGAIQQGQAQSQAAKYQAAVDRNNTILANRAAADAVERGKEAEATQRRKNTVLLARQRAAVASSGIELGTGSPLDILGDTAQFGELDAQTIRSNAERERLGDEAKASNFTASAGLNDMKASSASTAGMLGGVSALAGGAQTVAANWYKMK
jgi:hypothetical protein